MKLFSPWMCYLDKTGDGTTPQLTGIHSDQKKPQWNHRSLSKTLCSMLWEVGNAVVHLSSNSKTKHTLSIFLFAVFLPHSLLSCSLIACNSLPKWIILSIAAWLPPHSWRLNWLESTSAKTISSSSPPPERKLKPMDLGNALISL